MREKHKLTEVARTWKATYRDANRHLIGADPEFAAWLEQEYVPIGGGWQY